MEVMFLVMGLVIILSLCVIGGLFYFMNKENKKDPSAEAVPITDVAEIKGLASQDSADEVDLKRKGPSIASSSHGGEEDLLAAKAKLASLEKTAETQDPYNFSGTFAPLTQTKPTLTTGSESNQNSDRIVELEAQVAMITQKTVEQAEEAVKVIERLMKENEQLKMNHSVISSGLTNAQDAATFLELKEKNALLENQMDLSVSKVAQLESQISIVKKELGQQLLEANATIARLKVESEAQERATRDSLYRTSQELEELRQSSVKEKRETEEGLLRAKEENLLLRDAKKLLEAKLAVLEDDSKKEIEQSKQMVVDMAGQKDALVARIVELEKDLSKYKDLNTTLIDKAKILQYELNRHRAQASGLEKVCDNFKLQMDEMLQQIEQAKKDNNKLLQERINLEAGVVSLRTENSRLIEKDKTYQQELEKTKEQINRFEQIYKSFQSNIPKNTKDSV